MQAQGDDSTVRINAIRSFAAAAARDEVTAGRSKDTLDYVEDRLPEWFEE